MGVIRATVRDGKIIADAPADWPDGETFELVRVDERPEEERWGLSEDEWDDSPEGIEVWCAWLNSLEPFMTAEEEATWQADRAARKAQQKATFLERAEKLRRMWDDG